ncbi:uncharacterized protein LOC130737284 [Lotus japonicus]|uniref:uncharacterized protein LOC130737284 n=1 Tax=Lotus japonicus TaxID=34305 RepID=UPI00258ABFC6|nr:uncharacterized protein LOC130737284 [Lotus japonicus]
MGYGGLMRDSQGDWICGFHGFQAGGSALLSEARALKLGLQIAWDRGYKDVICNVDCRDLLRVLDDPETWIFFPVLREIYELRMRSWNLTLSAINRDCNQPADWLAKKGASSPSMAICVLEAPPSTLEILILRDRLTIP